VNTDLYVSWINGELIFRDSTFNAIVETLERKYNVTIENKNEALAKTVLTATFNINIESIRDVLNAINKIQPLNFTINDKHITILP
jgi:ferric-dicitrate binding protein FerR (iron transport regulator)